MVGNHYQPVLVDVVEHNTCITSLDSFTTLDQVIFRRWSSYRGQHNHWVTEWRLVIGDCTVREVGDRKWVTWTDSAGTHTVSARSFRRTRTIGDPERIEKDKFPECCREPYLRSIDPTQY